MTAVQSIDPRTGVAVEQVTAESTPDDVDRACTEAAEVATAWGSTSRDARGHALRAMATALEDDAEAIVAAADRETALGSTRLQGELRRTAFQFRLFADVLADGGYLEATVDHAGDTPMGPRPDLRRMLVPLGPVAVYGASNFPLAFSVPGGDTASALAAGCPVVVKAHPLHPKTSELCFQALRAALQAAGAPIEVVSLVHGFDAGTALVQHRDIRAAAFTGSLRGGRALHDLAAGRPDPIPFYGELGSLNPVVLCPGATAADPAALAKGLADSISLGAGQFCTKPGLVFVPAGPDGDTVRDALAADLAGRAPMVLLGESIRQAFTTTSSRFSAHAMVRRPSVAGRDSGDDGVAALVLEVDAADLDDELSAECFGPLAIAVRYSSSEELLTTLRRLPSSLTASVHSVDADLPLARRLEALLRERAGRLVWNGFPTGVAVSWAMQHGGPWPATTSIHTSVGATAIRRFLRPVAWQNAPLHLLPAELRDDEPGFPSVPTRVDGVLQVPG